MHLTIYVPAQPERSDIAPASGIVGVDHDNGRVLVYFEGNLNRADNIKTICDRLMHAAGRLVQRYPTVAKAFMPSDELVAVGTYDAVKWRIVSITAPDALKAWIGDEPLPQIIDPTTLRFVVHAFSESSNGEGGFWSNDQGWGSALLATRFTEPERDALALPSSLGNDARWVPFNHAD